MNIVHQRIVNPIKDPRGRPAHVLPEVLNGIFRSGPPVLPGTIYFNAIRPIQHANRAFSNGPENGAFALSVISI